MAKEVESNIARCKVNEMIDMLSPLIVGCANGKDMPAINLSGPPGIGKSDGIKALARRVSEMTHKPVYVHDVRLLNMNPVDLRGIPSKAQIDWKHQVDTANPKTNELESQIIVDKVDVARWLRPEIFQMEDTNDCINFLFLDEITAAPQSVQAAAYQLVLDRKVGEHKLPNNCYVFCAGNRVTDKSVAYKMPKALANRMCHLEIYADIDDWKKWAFNAGIDSRIIGFLNFKNEALFMFDPAKDDLAYPTPRTWAMVDNFLKKIPNIEACLPLISGAVGVGVATEFFGYAKVYSSLPDIDGIFAGKNVPYPSKMDVNYALSSSLVTKALKANKKQVNNMITWLNDWEPDYAVLTIMDCVKTTKLKQMIIDLPAWITWYKNHRELVVNL